MTIRSMTGFGRGSAQGRGVQITVELNSVNRRQLEIRLTLPRPLAPLEPFLIRMIQRALSRGQISGTVSLSLSDRLRQKGVRVDRPLARAYIQALREISRELRLENRFEADLLTRLPEVLGWNEEVARAEALQSVSARAMGAALQQLVAMRKKEGQILQRDLAERLKAMTALQQKIARRAPRILRRHRALLLARLKRARLPLRPEDPALLQEIAAFAERCEISEETVRLHSHLQQAARLLTESREPVGRPLDFLAQEMLREINTIGSKASDLAVVRQVVAFKTELERFREQVQNVE